MTIRQLTLAKEHIASGQSISASARLSGINPDYLVTYFWRLRKAREKAAWLNHIKETLANGGSLRDLAVDLNIPYETLRRRCLKDGIRSTRLGTIKIHFNKKASNLAYRERKKEIK